MPVILVLISLSSSIRYKHDHFRNNINFWILIYTCILHILLFKFCDYVILNESSRYRSTSGTMSWRHRRVDNITGRPSIESVMHDAFTLTGKGRTTNILVKLSGIITGQNGWWKIGAVTEIKSQRIAEEFVNTFLLIF